MCKPGEVAHIWQNPLLREGDKGFGILREKKNETAVYEFWLVEFPDTGERSINRLIKFDYGW